MTQRRITRADFIPTQDALLPDCVLDEDDLANIKVLAGINDPQKYNKYFNEGSNISKTANEKAELMRKHNIKPGTEEWFKLWFSLPYMTGEKPIKK